MNSSSVKPFKILLVEDDLICRTVLQKLLAKSSLPISEVKSAESLGGAFELLDNNHFDVVLLDLNLPDSEGLDTLVRVTERHPSVAIIVVTGEYGENVGLKAVASGAQEYLTKDNYNIHTLSKSIYYAVERKRIHKILDQKQRNLEAIFDAVPIGMLLIDKNMIVNRVNDAIRQMVQKEYSEIINLRVGGALSCINSTYNKKGCGHSPDCAACPIIKTVESALDSEQPVRGVEFQFTLKIDNKETTPWLSISAEPVVIDGCRYAIVVINDITERKKAEEKLKETMEIKSQFISTVSHELRTPLASMKESLAIVLDEVVGQLNEKQKKFLDIANRNTNRLGTLINDILDFQKLESGRIKLDIGNNDITEVVSEVHETMALSAKRNGVELLVEFAEDLPEAKFDRSKIIEVLTNLISNAIKFTPEKGRVSVKVQRQNEELIIKVSDTGIGIPKKDLSKIFDRFYRVHQPGKQINGTGLGLAIVKKIVMMHGGRIEVESDVDQGTTFTVFLPLAAKFIPEASSAKMDQLLEETTVNN